MNLDLLVVRLAAEYGPVGSAMILVAIGFVLGMMLVAAAWCCVQSQADLNAAKVEMLETYIATKGKATTLTDEERASVGVAVQCVEAAMAQKHPEEDDARELLHRTSCALRKLLERMK